MTDEPIRILSADAPKEGLRQGTDLYGAETGATCMLELATWRSIKDRTVTGTADADIIVIPRAELEELAAAGLVDPASIATLCVVTVGAAVKNGAREPDLSSAETFIASVRSARRIIYNAAASGQFVAKMFERIGLAGEIEGKTLVAPTGGAAMEALAADTSGSAIGFAHVTEIRRFDHLGIHLVGPLPTEVGRGTPYAAGVPRTAPRAVAAKQLIEFLVGPQGERVFADSGTF